MIYGVGMSFYSKNNTSIQSNTLFSLQNRAKRNFAVEEGDHVSLLNVFRAFLKVGIQIEGKCIPADCKLFSPEFDKQGKGRAFSNVLEHTNLHSFIYRYFVLSRNILIKTPPPFVSAKTHTTCKSIFFFKVLGNLIYEQVPIAFRNIHEL